MRYFSLLVVMLMCTACSAQNASLMGSRVKPLNAEQELQARELQGGDIQMGQRRMTVLSNVKIAPSEGANTDAQTIATIMEPFEFAHVKFPREALVLFFDR